MQQCGCSCKLGEKSQINKFLSRKLIIQPGLGAWIIYSGKLWALCMERATLCDWVERFVSSSWNRNVIKTTPTSSHNSWTWKCLSSAFPETPRRGQVLHVGESSFMTFDFWHFFLRSLSSFAPFVIDSSVLFTAGNVFFTTSFMIHFQFHIFTEIVQ